MSRSLYSIYLFILTLIFFFSVFSCLFPNNNISVPRVKTDLEKSQEALDELFDETNAYSAVAQIGKTSFKNAIKSHQGYLITVNGNTYLPLDGNLGEIVIMYDDKNMKSMEMLNAAGARTSISENGSYEGKKYIIFNYTNKASLSDFSGGGALNLPHLQFNTTSSTFKIAFKSLAEHKD